MPKGFRARIKENLSACLPDQLILTLQSADNVSGRDRYSAPFSNRYTLDYLFLGISFCPDDGVMATYHQTNIDQNFHTIYLIISADGALIVSPI